MKAFTLSFALILAAASNLQAAVIYGPTVIGSSARISDYGSATQTGFRPFDNFTPAFDASVETVTWLGFFLDQTAPTPAPAPLPDVESWDIAFYADNVDAPGSQLSFESFAAADVTSAFVGTGTFIAGGTFNVNYYQYSATLTSPFMVTGGTEYWFSVLSRSSSYYPTFTLLGATGGDSASYQQLLGAGMSIDSAYAVAADRAVRLEGTPVPEPSTMMLLATGIGLSFSRRFRRGTH